MRLGISKALIATLLTLLFMPGCAKNPATGKKELTLVSESQEIEIGRESHPEILRQFGVAENEVLQSYFSDTGSRIAAISHRPNLPWHFTVVDDPVVNAFAVPGGYIYFTRGILAYMNNEAEMAGVLGHEIGHVTARHSVTQMSRAQLFGLGLGLGSIFSPEFRQFSGLAQMGVGLLFLKYGRDDERQSDRLGVEYMYKAGYDPREISGFFEVLARLDEQKGRSIPGWLSTHPTPPSRIRDTRALARDFIAQAEETGELQVRSEPFLRQLKDTVFGENPREGFSENGRFYHPDLRFQLDYPDSWGVHNSKTAVVFVDPSQAGGVQLTLAPPEASSPEGRARELARQDNVQMLEGFMDTVNGGSAYLAVYDIRTESGSILRSLAAFFDHRGHLFQLMGISPAADFDRYNRAFRDVISSFRTLTDQRILSVQADRLDLYTIRRGGTIEDVARLFPNERVDADDLALLNRVDRKEALKSGTLIKVVRSGW